MGRVEIFHSVFGDPGGSIFLKQKKDVHHHEFLKILLVVELKQRTAQLLEVHVGHYIPDSMLETWFVKQLLHL